MAFYTTKWRAGSPKGECAEWFLPRGGKASHWADHYAYDPYFLASGSCPLTPRQIAVFSQCVSLVNQNRGHSINHGYLALRCGIEKVTAKRAMKVLVKAGLFGRNSYGNYYLGEFSDETVKWFRQVGEKQPAKREPAAVEREEVEECFPFGVKSAEDIVAAMTPTPMTEDDKQEREIARIARNHHLPIERVREAKVANPDATSAAIIKALRAEDKPITRIGQSDDINSREEDDDEFLESLAEQR